MVEDADELYALPLDDFTEARNALAARLKADDPDRAKQVKALKKPNVAAWVLNQLARSNRDEIEDFLALGTRLKQAEAEALGGGGASGLRRVASEERDTVAALVQRAEWIARKAEVNVTPAVAQKLGDTLRAAVVDEDARRLLLAGTLTTDLQRVGFGEAAPGARPTPTAKKKQERVEQAQRDTERAETAEQRERRERARDEAEGARAAVREADAEAARLERALRHAEREAERLERDAERAAREAKEAAARAKDARTRVAELRTELRAAETAAERARRRAERTD